jgi:preprotein translocase subunit SecF
VLFGVDGIPFIKAKACIEMRNIYESKNYKRYAIIPIALLLISLIFIPYIQLDSSLRGGVTITIQTSSAGSINQRALVSYIDSNIPGAQATVAKTTGGLSVTLANNQSISSAQARLTSAYSAYSTYSAAVVQQAVANDSLKNSPGNSTLIAEISAAQKNITTSIASIRDNVSAGLASMSPFLKGKPSYNDSNPSQMVSALQGSIANASAAYESKVISALKSEVPFTTYSYNEVTPTLGSFFLGQMFNIIIYAFILVAIIVFFIFRTVIPSIAVVFGAANDIIIALGAMGAFGIPMGTATIGGLLMLIGYAIDTELLSSIRILKRSEETPESRAFGSMKTGLTMTSTAIIVFSALFVISYIAFIPTYFEIAGVVLAGLIGDIFTTWFGNTVFVLWYKKKRDVLR